MAEDRSNWLRTVALLGASGVLLGAFGAHALQRRITDVKMLKNWDTAAHYHLIHSAAALGAVAVKNNTAAALFVGGVSLFSGSLYVMVLTGERRLGMMTPIGGLLLTAGWIALAWSAGGWKAE